MKSLLHAIILVSFVSFAPLVVVAAAGDVVINEIAWMGTAASPSDEWIELHNTTQSAIDLSGWTFSFFKPATTTPSKAITLSGNIPAGGFYLIERTDDNATDVLADLVSSFGTGLVDGGMILELAHNGAVVDRTSDPCENKWCAGSNNPEMTMERIDPKKGGSLASNWATNNGAKINGKDAAGNLINGTPKRENSVASFQSSSSSSPISSPSSFSSSSSVSPSHPIYPALSVDVGPDRTVLVGSSVSFSGLALGINNAPLLDARFLWNFGDGVVQEGKAFEHMYYFPGIYTVALTVSSGPYSGFDFAAITAIVPQLSVKNMLSGEDGFVIVASGSDAKIDLGGMILRDSIGAQFLIPKNTLVLAKGEVTFPNRVSGLLKSGGAVSLYDAVGRLLREQPQIDNEQPRTAFDMNGREQQNEYARTKISERPQTITHEQLQAIDAEVALVDDTSGAKETAAISSASAQRAGGQAPQNAKSGISKTSLFFMASVFVGLISAAGFFWLKNLF